MTLAIVLFATVLVVLGGALAGAEARALRRARALELRREQPARLEGGNSHLR